ncbi:dGTP triphosphohydrolase [Pseudorhodoferax aquiterrae]|nr:dNTP triphosphohydrolase [Pseudorhodoferax aquiterrae]
MKNNPLYVGTEQLARPSGNDGSRPAEIGRDAFRKDYARLLHAPSFRRLQGKTQLFPGAEDDFFRNRLTHSLEVAQIAHGIASRLNATAKPAAFQDAYVNTHLVEFAALAHDLGHPPFGHNGEAALDELMRDSGGFEGNAQTLRILTAVERKLIHCTGKPPSSSYGLDLTYRSLAAVLKYDRPIPKKRKKRDGLAKGYYGTEADLVAAIRRKVAPGLPDDRPLKTIECDIMDIADDIAYSTYDLEDSLHAGFVSPMSLAHALVSDASLRTAVVEKTNKALLEDQYEEVDGRELLEVIADVFDISLPPTFVGLLKSSFLAGKKGRKEPAVHFVDDVVPAKVESWLQDQKFTSDPLGRTQLTAERVGRLISSVDLVLDEEFPQLSRVKLTRQAKLQVEVLKHLNYELVIRSPRLAIVEHRGRDLVSKIFTTVCDSDGALLPTDWQTRYAVTSSDLERRRMVCDFVAGMTDRYAAEFHARLLGNGATIFKPF